MRRRRYDWDEARIARYMGEGRGQGTGADYRPWLTVADVPSRGLSSRPMCEKAKRERHFLSRNEYRAFLDLWWDDSVVDIREQFPLPRLDTLAIARRRGVKHPRDVRSGTPLVQTTDMLATRRVGGQESFLAVAVKTESDIEDEIVLQKLDIERTYWQIQEISWKLVLDTDVRNRRVTNLDWLFQSRWQVPSALDHRLAVLEGGLATTISASPHVPARVSCTQFDALRCLESGTGLMLLRGLLRRKRAAVDLWSPRIQEEPGAKFFFPGI